MPIEKGTTSSEQTASARCRSDFPPATHQNGIPVSLAAWTLVSLAQRISRLSRENERQSIQWRELAPQRGSSRREWDFAWNLASAAFWETATLDRGQPSEAESRTMSLLLVHVLLLAFAMGFVGGLRSLTAPAVVCWAARLGVLSLRATPLGFLSSSVAVAVFTVLALAELVADKLPNTPARTAAMGLLARFLLGGLCGSALALASQPVSWIPAALLGAAGGIVGAFAGYQARIRLAKILNVPDFVIALTEDAVAIAAAILIVTHV